MSWRHITGGPEGPSTRPVPEGDFRAPLLANAQRRVILAELWREFRLLVAEWLIL
jgi:hypothetical protein